MWPDEWRWRLETSASTQTRGKEASRSSLIARVSSETVYTRCGASGKICFSDI
jgi:hypothetical protein